MASLVVMEAPAATAGAPEEKVEFIRDGFSFWAFVFPFIWLLWHRLWIEAVIVLGAGVAVAYVGTWPDIQYASSAFAVLISLFVGLEGANLRVAASRRRGWQEKGVIEAPSAAEAALKYFAGKAEAAESSPAGRAAEDRPAAPAFRAGTIPPRGPALGLLGLPDGR